MLHSSILCLMPSISALYLPITKLTNFQLKVFLFKHICGLLFFFFLKSVKSLKLFCLFFEETITITNSQCYH